jgi:hypothetical protein
MAKAAAPKESGPQRQASPYHDSSSNLKSSLPSGTFFMASCASISGVVSVPPASVPLVPGVPPVPPFPFPPR